MGCSTKQPPASEHVPRPIHFSSVKATSSAGFEINVPTLPPNWGGWGLVLSGNVAECQLSIIERFGTIDGGGLSAEKIDLYINGKFTRLGFQSSNLTLRLTPQTDGVFSAVLYPLQGEQLQNWDCFAYKRETVNVSSGGTETVDAPSQCDAFFVRVTADVWTIKEQASDGGGYNDEGLLLSVTTGTPVWEFGAGMVPVLPPQKLVLSHDNGGASSKASIYWRIRL